MKKVLLVTNSVMHYRVPIFESLCDRINLTIAYPSKTTNEQYKFTQHAISIKSKGPFFIYQDLPDFEKFDIVILPFSIRCWELFSILFRKRKFQLFVFGIGVSASYSRFYDQSKKHDIIYKYILRRVDGAIFYDRYPFVKWISKGIDPKKLSIAYNTVSEDPKFDITNKTFESILFIGSLYKQKKVFDLLYAYEAIVNKFAENAPQLEIVGEGDEYEKIKDWIKDKRLVEKIILHGQINDMDTLRPIFSRSIVCISPGQAGLSVQKCFSYGVPFVTSHNAITGGENSSIIEGETGFFYDGTINGLNNILHRIIAKKINIEEMSRKCYMYYSDFRNVSIWRNGFLQNIDK